MSATNAPSDGHKAGGSLGIAILWMAGALVAFCVSGVSIRELAHSFSVFELLSLRSLFGIVAILAVTLGGRSGLAALAVHRPGLQGLRNGIHWIGQATWAYGVTMLPLATVFALEFTAPIWVTLLAIVFLGERITVPRAGAVVLGLVGVLVILRPGYLPLDLASIGVLVAALAFAVTAVATKKLTQTETTLSILFWMNVVQLPLNLAWCDPAFPARIEAWQAPAVLGVCASGLASHYCLAQALRHGDAMLIAPMDFLRVPLIALVGWWLYGERLDPLVLLGAASVVLGVTWSVASAARARRDVTSPPSPG